MIDIRKAKSTFWTKLDEFQFITRIQIKNVSENLNLASKSKLRNWFYKYWWQIFIHFPVFVNSQFESN